MDIDPRYEVDILKNDIKQHKVKIEWLEQFNRHQEGQITQLVNIIDVLRNEVNTNRTYINAIVRSQGLPELKSI